MAGRAFQRSFLIVAVVSSVAAGADQPRTLSDRQIRGVKSALQEPGLQLATLQWLTDSPCANEELVNPIAKCLTHSQADVGFFAASALEMMGERAAPAIPALIQLLQDPKANSSTRGKAADALGKIGEKAVDALIKLLEDPEGDVESKRYAARALGPIGPQARRAVPSLIKLCEDARADSTTKGSAAAALGGLVLDGQAKAAVSALIKLLEGEKIAPETKETAAGALGEIGKKAEADAAVAALIKLLESAQEEKFKQSAVGALAKIGKKAVPALIELCEDKRADSAFKRSAANVLGEIGEQAKEAVPALLKLLDNPQDITKIVVAQALGHIGDKAAAPALIKLLGDPKAEEDVREAVSRAVGAIGEKGAPVVPALTHMLEDPQADRDTKWYAGEALGWIGKNAAPAVPVLIRLLEDPNASIATKWQMVEDLWSIAKQEVGPPPSLKRAVPGLIKMLKESRGDLHGLNRGYAAMTLAKINDKAAVQILILNQMLEDKQADRGKSFAAVAVSEMGVNASAAAAPLIKLLEHPKTDSALLTLVARALGRTKGNASVAVPALIEVLDNLKGDKETLRETALALESYGARKAAVSALIKVLDNPTAGIDRKRETASALKRMGATAAAVPALIKVLKNQKRDDERREVLVVILQLDKERYFLMDSFVFLGRLDEASCKRISAWLRYGVQATPSQLCQTLEATFTRREGREDRRLDAYLVASDAQRPLIRWLGDRYEEKLPWDTLDHAHLSELMRQLAQLLPHAAETPKCRAEIVGRINDILRKESWSGSDLDALREVKKALDQASSDTTLVQNRIERLEIWQRVFGYVRSFGYLVAAHVAFWAVLLFAYPRFRWVQAFFFWNPWVRTITGLVYVPWLITVVPLFRRRLLAPFRENLVPQSFTDEFEADSYYGGSKMTSKREGKDVEQVASAYLKPPLTGSRVVEAPSGFGKTTLLRRFVTLTDRPVVVLRATECDKGVPEAIQQRLLGIAADEKFLQTLVYSGGLDVLIDGLNEAGPETRGLISAFVNKLFKGNYVLTSQPLLDFNVPRAAERWRLQALDPKEVEVFLRGQWVRVEPLAIKAGVAREQYDAQVQEVYDEFRAWLDDSDELYQFGPRTPMDASMIAELIAQGVAPDTNNLIAQYVDLASRMYRDTYPDREPRFTVIGARALKAMQEQSTSIDMSDLESECKVLSERRLLLSRDGTWVFRHDRLRDYFIADSLKRTDAIELRQDSRFAGVFEFLPDLLLPEDANELGELLRDEAATDKNSPVWPAWLKYKQLWRPPDAYSKIDGFVTRATVEFQKDHPGRKPRYELVGERAFAALESGLPIDLQGLEAERDSLRAGNIIRDGIGQIEFRTDELRDYFVAKWLDKDRAFEVRANERFFGVFGFLPRSLPRDDANSLGQKLKEDHKQQGKPSNSAWHHYKKHWRGPRKPGK
jgi:HEAT repeat protein